jgi:hypothetical protein
MSGSGRAEQWIDGRPRGVLARASHDFDMTAPYEKVIVRRRQVNASRLEAFAMKRSADRQGARAL